MRGDCYFYGKVEREEKEKIEYETKIAEEQYEDPLIKLRWEFIVKKRIKDPNVVLDMSNIRFFQWIRAIMDFEEKED